MKTLLVCISFALVQIVPAAERIPLWPTGKMPHAQDHQIAAPYQEAKAAGFDAAAHREPYLEWVEPAPAKPNGTCVIVISGGAYVSCCDFPAFEPHVRRLTEAGVRCVRLVYRTPRPKGLPIYQSAWEDGQRAVRVVRSEAAKRGIDLRHIGAMGCSAGSHLTLLLAMRSQTRAYAKVDEIDDAPAHLNFAIAMCPAYVLSDGLKDANARQGQMPDVRLDSLFTPERGTCPVCFLHGGNDPVSPNGSVRLYHRLRQNRIPAELHITADRTHGVSTTNEFTRAMEFLTQLGHLGPLAATEKAMARFDRDLVDVRHEKQTIWPAGKMPDVQTNQCLPYLEWYQPTSLKTRAIQIAFSGGGYNGNNPDNWEVVPLRRYLNAKGMTVVTLKYRTPRPPAASGLAKHTPAWEDLQRTIRLVRQAAPARGLDPRRIGVMGGSAGGHLALLGAFNSLTDSYYSYTPAEPVDRTDCSVQWALVNYPAYLLTDGADGENTTRGDGEDVRLVADFAFDRRSAPVLFMHGDEDVYSAMGSVRAWEQLRRIGVQGELHTTVRRGHCYNLVASPGTFGHDGWMELSWDFLRRKGFLNDYTGK